MFSVDQFLARRKTGVPKKGAPIPGGLKAPIDANWDNALAPIGNELDKSCGSGDRM